jgi:hypothetical protein
VFTPPPHLPTISPISSISPRPAPPRPRCCPAEQARQELPSGPGGEFGNRYYITQGAAGIKDSAKTVYSLFLLIAGVTLAVVFILYWIGKA